MTKEEYTKTVEIGCELDQYRMMLRGINAGKFSVHVLTDDFSLVSNGLYVNDMNKLNVAVASVIKGIISEKKAEIDAIINGRVEEYRRLQEESDNAVKAVFDK